MKYLVTVLVLGLAGSALAGQEARPDPSALLKARLEKFKQLTPEQKQKLKERMEQLKKLPAVERNRMVENLRKFSRLSEKEKQTVREKVQRLTPEEKKAFVEVSAGFFQWAHKQGFLEGFPREVFFQWMRADRADDLAKLREMEPADRKDAFVKLYFEFKAVSLQRLRDHNRRPAHRCNTDEQLKDLADAGPREFWPELKAAWQRCPGVRKDGFRSNGGPVAPRRDK